MKPVYFDLTVFDVEATRKFLENVFDWRFEKFPMPYEYYRIQAGPENEPGIDGGVGEVKDSKISGGKPLTLITIGVEDLDECLNDVKENGGSILEPKMAIPGVGWYATCSEPGGLPFGLIQTDPNAT
ncbi:MAG: VOC family protein [Candidatus Bathyarchaeota archaeon]|nr:VOC family protein [Candidatus Bathyarchaeota archaeon]